MRSLKAFFKIFKQEVNGAVSKGKTVRIFVILERCHPDGTHSNYKIILPAARLAESRQRRRSRRSGF